MRAWEYYAATRNLPEGHYDKKRAEKTLEKEYAECSKLSVILRKRFKHANRYMDIEEAREIITYLSKCFNGKRPVVCINPKMWCGGRFNAPNIISFQSRTISSSIVYHEMAHFMCCSLRLYDTHRSQDFLTCLELMWEEAEKFYKDRYERSSFPGHGVQTISRGDNGVANSSIACVPGMPSLRALD